MRLRIRYKHPHRPCVTVCECRSRSGSSTMLVNRRLTDRKAKPFASLTRLGCGTLELLSETSHASYMVTRPGRELRWRSAAS